MDTKQLTLRLDPDWTFNVNTQIREQLKCLIAMGIIQSGDMLPTANQLAEELGVNRNTINLVYNQLRDEGFVTMNKSRGTQVTAKGQLYHEQSLLLMDLIKETVKQVEMNNIELKPFFMTGLAYALQQSSFPAGQADILFVECKGHDHIFYRQVIEKTTGLNVETLFLEDLPVHENSINDKLQHIKIVVTTLNHAKEVKKYFAASNIKILVIGADVEPSLLLEISSLEKNTRVSFICLGKIGGEWMARRVQEAGIHHLNVKTFGWEGEYEQEESLRLLQKTDRVYASAAVFPALFKLAPDKVVPYPMRLEQSSANLLNDISIHSDMK
ncbi:GntR family transcriptional regulator [Paenibacillus amylolyticus]|uniref:GntR family transcriptional regulator n=1 Tax=Paenibacillus amylolyticus TaxID=1451 RepID=UPI003D9688F5